MLSTYGTTVISRNRIGSTSAANLLQEERMFLRTQSSVRSKMFCRTSFGSDSSSSGEDEGVMAGLWGSDMLLNVFGR